MDLRELGSGQTRRHPWERARVIALRRILQGIPLSADAQVLEVGCGDGYAVGSLCKGRAVAAVDPNLSDEQLRTLRGRYHGFTFARRLEDLPRPRADLLLQLTTRRPQVPVVSAGLHPRIS